MRTMYDAVTPSNIPADAQMVAGYVDGRYAWSAADWARFPHAVKVRIAVFPSTNDGVVLDVEPGDATPAQAPGWVQMRRAAGVDPTVYCSLADWPAVRAAFRAAGVAEPHYWIAAYPGNGAQLYDGAVAHQHTDAGGYDLSVVADQWPGVDPSPTTPRGGSGMPEYLKEILPGGGSGRYARIDGGVVTGTDEATAHATLAAWKCGSEQGVTPAEMDDHIAKSNAITGVLPAINTLVSAVHDLTAAVHAGGAVGGTATLDQVRALGKELINGTSFTSHID